MRPVVQWSVEQSRGRTLVRVGPEQVAEQALVRHVCRPHDPPNLLHRLQVRREACETQEYELHLDVNHSYHTHVLARIFFLFSP